jgi:hypothetical protein
MISASQVPQTGMMRECLSNKLIMNDLKTFLDFELTRAAALVYAPLTSTH